MPRAELVAFEPRRPVPWDAVATIPVWILVALSIAGAFMPAPTLTAAALANDIVTKLVIALVLLALVVLRSHATAADVGFQPRKLLTDVRLGVLTFLPLAIVVYGIQFALLGGDPDPKAKHQIVEALEHNPSQAIILLAILDAVIVAPLVEEFMFRVVLQGWLEKVFARAEPADGQKPQRAAIAALAPIVLTAAIFASLHLRFHEGVPDPDPIPLFVLALGLGYLYRQTHRLTPSLVVHVLLNGCSMALLLVQIFYAPAK